jgi:hypothetical protein
MGFHNNNKRNIQGLSFGDRLGHCNHYRPLGHWAREYPKLQHASQQQCNMGNHLIMVKIMNQRDHKHKEMVEEREFDESIPIIFEISVLTLKAPILTHQEMIVVIVSNKNVGWERSTMNVQKILKLMFLL